MAFQGTLPNNDDSPTICQQSIDSFAISCHVASKFFSPEFGSCCRSAGGLASMSMPEATVHKNYSAIFGENQVWAAWEAAPVKTVAQATRMESPAQQEFGLCVFSMNIAHIAPSLFTGQHIGHFRPLLCGLSFSQAALQACEACCFFYVSLQLFQYC